MLKHKPCSRTINCKPLMSIGTSKRVAEAFLCIRYQFHFLHWQKTIYSDCCVKHPERLCLHASFSANETDFVRPSVTYQVNFQSVAYGFCGNFEALLHGADIRWLRSQYKWPMSSRCHANTTLLPAMHYMAILSGNMFVFQQDSILAHRARETVEFLSDELHTQFHQFRDVAT